MRRRDFINVVVGAAAVWPFATRAQQSNPLRRIGVLMAHKEGDPVFQDYLGAFRQGLREVGWVEGHNIQIDTRWGALERTASATIGK
jgi:putative ABC transport system substrate-binding protein